MTPERTRRRGWSLIELLAVITMTGILLGLVTMLLGGLLRLDSAERARGVAASSLERLGRDLRAAAHASVGPVSLARGRLAVPQAGGVVQEFVIRPRDVVRTARRGEKTLDFELYKRPTGTLARFEAGPDGPGRVDSLILSADPAAAPTKAPDPAFGDFRIDFHPGRDARLTRGTRP